MSICVLGRLWCVLVLAIAAAGVKAQSINVDLDIGFGPPEVGNGAPSGSFGGAAGQPGFWNRVDALDMGPTFLAGLDAQQTSAFMTATYSGFAGGSGGGPNTGDWKLLLDDYTTIFGGPKEFKFSGLQPGVYALYVYAVVPGGVAVRPVEVHVGGADPPNPQTVWGPMPGNSARLYVTHSLHFVRIEMGEELTALLTGPQFPQGVVNGFQLVLVAEPCSALVLCGGALLLALGRRR